MCHQILCSPLQSVIRLSEEKFYDYTIELKGKPKLDVTQPDSETTSIIKQFKNFQFNGSNFNLFKAQLDVWYASKIATLNEQIYELAEQMKDFPEIDETNFQFEDRKKLSKEQKMELMSHLPMFTEEWRDKLSVMMRMMSKAFTNSIFLINILWDSNKKMSEFLEGKPIAVQTPMTKILTPTAVQKIAGQAMLSGKRASEIARDNQELGINTNNASSLAYRGIRKMIKNGEIDMEEVRKKLPDKAESILNGLEVKASN